MIIGLRKIFHTKTRLKFSCQALHLEMSIRDFAKSFDVTHRAVLKWGKEESRMNPSTELCAFGNLKLKALVFVRCCRC